LYIYFIGDQRRAIKIGVTSGLVEWRLRNLQIGNADELTLLAVLREDELRERDMHERFSHLCIRSEWFHATEELMDYILSLPGVDMSKVQEWWDGAFWDGNVTEAQRRIIIEKAKLEAKQIIAQAHQEARGILEGAISDAIGRIREYATVEIKEIISDSLGGALFDRRCCHCGRVQSTVRERDDGFPWCDICWVNYAIFGSGRFDDILARVSDKALSL